MADIKVGDTVRFTGNWYGGAIVDEGVVGFAKELGKGTVDCVDLEEPKYRVAFPGKRISYWYHTQEVEKVEEPAMFKVGDKVLVPAVIDDVDARGEILAYKVKSPTGISWVPFEFVRPYVESPSEKKQRVRAEALAKLTDEEKEELGLTLAAFRF
jgi:hypothetical protein